MVSKLLDGALALLMIDSAAEMGLIVATVRWLNVTAGRGFEFNYGGTTHFLNGKPLHFMLDQGHTTNGAAGTGLVAVGIGGILALSLRNRQLKRNGTLTGFTAFLYNFWLYFTAVAAVFTVAAFVYVYTVTYTHAGQHIDPQFASTLHNGPLNTFQSHNPYPRDTWTPQNWYPAVLELNLTFASQRSSIKTALAIMRAWQWNLIPMMILSITVAVLAYGDKMKHARVAHRAHGAWKEESTRQWPGSSQS